MATSFDNFDDFEDFLNEIDEDVKDIKVEITLDLQHKTIDCYLCGETVKVNRSFRWVETCPDCVARLRARYVRGNPQLFE